LVVEPEAYMPGEAIDVARLCVLACLAASLALLWKPRGAEAYVVTAALAPVALCILASTLFSTHIFYSRYLLFAFLFILVSLGLLMGRVRMPVVRRLTAGLVLLLMLWLDLRFIDKLDLTHNPAASGVVDYIK